LAAPASDAPRIRAAAAILDDRGRVLLVRHRKGGAEYHLLPGGGVDPGETLEQAARREVLEETGYKVEVGSLLFVSDKIDPSGVQRHVVNITFAARIVGGKPTSKPDDKRVVGVDWVSPDGLAALDLRPPMAEQLAGAARDGFCGPGRYLGSLWAPAGAPGPVL
jgi:8-oxo-dGTP diphosphatase